MTSTGSQARNDGVDATRGLALLGSATATALLWLHGRQLGPGYRPLDGTALDHGVDLVTALLVDNRVLAVFALLLGYGLTEHLHRVQPSQDGAAEDRAVAGVLRRSALLVGIGAVHATLLLEADVLATLGVVMLLALPLVRARWGGHLLVVLVVVPPLLVHGAADGLGGSAGFPDPPADYLLSVVDRVGTWLLALVLLPFTQVGLLVAAVAGIRLARSGWLAEPAAHRRGLALLGVGAAVVGLLGAAPYALSVAAGAVADLVGGTLAGALSSLTGPAGAVGAVCLSVLLMDLTVERTGSRNGPGRLHAALALLGRRSLLVYLSHSLVLALVLAPWAGGWGARWGSAGVVALGAALWAATLLAVVLWAATLPAVVLWAATLPAAVLWAATLPAAVRPASRSGTPVPASQPTERQGLARSSAT